jgi:hypothetical protein
MSESIERHVASTCARPGQETYDHRTSFRADHSQTVGRQRSPALKNVDGGSDAVGELWFERTDDNAPIPALLLKLLFTREPLSIQVHPDDNFARAMGMPNGKSEAWYIISAEPARRSALG